MGFDDSELFSVSNLGRKTEVPSHLLYILFLVRGGVSLSPFPHIIASALIGPDSAAAATRGLPLFSKAAREAIQVCQQCQAIK